MPEDWPDFSARLGRVLAELAPAEKSVILIIMDASEPGCLVQYICGGDGGGTWAEVAGNKSLPKHRRLSKDDEQRLRSTGWDKPSGSMWSLSPVRVPNWHTDRFSVPKADYGALADMSVTALRDVLHIASPAGLMYDAFDHATGEPVALDALGIPREPA